MVGPGWVVGMVEGGIGPKSHVGRGKSGQMMMPERRAGEGERSRRAARYSVVSFHN